MIDTHTHIYEPEFDNDREAVIERARKAGVEQLILPNIDEESIERMKRLYRRHPDYCRMAMGLHPSSVDIHYKERLKKMETLFADQPYYAVGEIGIDLYWDKSYVREQIEAFEIQLHWASELGLPVIIHVREALPEVLAVLRRCASLNLKGIFHSFGGNAYDVSTIADTGCFLFGINGIVTFKNSRLKETLPHIGIERIVLETDAPYLAPVPYRGKRNEPAYLPHIVESIAEALQIAPERVKQQTTNNARQLFGLEES